MCDVPDDKNSTDYDLRTKVTTFKLNFATLHPFF